MKLSDNSCCCAKMQESSRKYHEFISRLSHEIRNPLTLIYSSLQLLEVDCPEITDHSLWPQLKQDVLNTIQLLKDVSSLNRQQHIPDTIVSVPDLLHRTAVSCSAMMQNRRISFTVECSPSLSQAAIRGDELRLLEALTNLLINAADAVSSPDRPGHISPSDSSEVFLDKIRLFAEPEHDSVCIHVTDNGPGIPEEYLDTLFEPFVTHKPNGTGLGLNIVKNIAAQHGGSITVHTDTGKAHSFTDFCLRIPLHTAVSSETAAR